MKVDMTDTLGEDVKKYLNQGAQIDFREFREKNKWNQESYMVLKGFKEK